MIVTIDTGKVAREVVAAKRFADCEYAEDALHKIKRIEDYFKAAKAEINEAIDEAISKELGDEGKSVRGHKVSFTRQNTGEVYVPKESMDSVADKFKKVKTTLNKTAIEDHLGQYGALPKTVIDNPDRGKTVVMRFLK